MISWAGILGRVISARFLPFIALLVVSACSSSDASQDPTSSGPAPTARAPTAAPAMSETFARLPCRPATTIGQQGCAEAAVLRADAAINRDLATLWRRARSSAARARLGAAQNAWLVYRSATCASEADAFEGGSQAAVVSAQCLARLTRERADDLASQRALVP